MTNLSPTQCIVCYSIPLKIEWNDLPLFQCPHCGLAWQREFHTHAEYYRSDAYSWDDSNMSARLRNCADRIRILRAYMPLDSLCDVGAGEGAFLMALKEKSYANLLGIEPHPEAVAYGTARGIDLVQGTLEDHTQELRERSIRSITLFHVIEHMEEPRKALGDMYAVLPPGGFLVIETPTTHSPVLRAKGYRDKLVYNEHLFYFNEENLSKLLSDEGFRVIASIRRDFDVSHMPLSESLQRLGLPTNRLLRAFLRPFQGIIYREIVRKEKLNYMMSIAQKPLQ